MNAPVARPAWCYHHSRQRLAERYGVGLTVQQYQQLCGLLQHGEGELLAYGFNGREIWAVQHQGQRCTAVYDPEQSLIVTFLDKGAYRKPPYDRHAKHRDKKRKQRRAGKPRRMSQKRLRQERRRGAGTFFHDWED